MIIAIEGGMGSGKSTMGELLATVLDDALFFGEAMDYLSTEDRMELFSVTGTSRAIDILYKGENFRKQKILEIAPNESTTIILDRSYLTFVAFEFARKNQEEFKYALRAKETMSPIIPDIILFFSTEHEERIERLRKRDGDRNSGPMSFLLAPEFNASLENYFKLISPIQTIFIDTSRKTPEMILEEVLPIIGSFKTKITEKVYQKFVI